MENLPNDAISLPSRVFYSPSEDKLYFGEVGDYKEVPNLDDIPTKTSDLTNDGDGVNPFVTSSGVTSVSGTANQIVSTGGNTPVLSLHSDIMNGISLANSAIQSDVLASAINVRMFTIELTNAQVLALNTTPYDITSTDLGLGTGEKVKWLLDRCEWKVDGNGESYGGSIRLYSHSQFSPIWEISLKNDGHRAGMGIISDEYGYEVSDTHHLRAGETIIGGVSGATVKIRLYYTTTIW